MTAPTIQTRLLAGDQLQSPDKTHSLSALYGLTPKEIVVLNGTSFTSAAIDAWVLRTGGKRLSNGQAVFTENSVILLPAGGPRAPAASASETGVEVKQASFGWIMGLVVVGLIVGSMQSKKDE